VPFFITSFKLDFLNGYAFLFFKLHQAYDSTQMHFVSFLASASVVALYKIKSPQMRA
jgi:hypothetical protein